MSDHLTLGDGVGRAAMIGVAIGLVVVATLAGAIGLAGGMPWNDAVGFGVVVGVWAGPGFGAIIGGTAAIARNERLEAPRVQR
jgi:hypothetical protein